MFRGLRLFWDVFRWWEKVLVVILLPAVIVVVVILAIASRADPYQNRQPLMDEIIERANKIDREKEAKIKELDEEITAVFKKKAEIDKEKDDALQDISGCNNIECLDDVLLERRERRRADRRGN